MPFPSSTGACARSAFEAPIFSSPETDRLRAQGIIDACRARRVVLGAGRTSQVTISAGLAHLSAGEGGAELELVDLTPLYEGA